MRTSTALVALWIAVLVTVVVGIDVLWLRHHAWLRLGANVGIVAAFGLAWLLLTRRG